ncbi:MAG: bifunctional phosphoglucose/phosphomannose isomerase [Candidatus Omnitrophica bacterium]|nr:bifunctional phosphoglucose/phosphomannose isomerase [Candidatus Omnitrophota bacterium]
MKNILADVANIKELDKSNMLGLLIGFDEQCKEAVSIGKQFEPSGISGNGVKNIVFTGLGGSAIGADLIRSYTADEMKVPIIVNRDYTIPNFIDKDTLLFAASYSGNTEETLSAYDKAREKKARILAISSDGKLQKAAKSDGIPFIKIPAGIPPRCALGYSFIPPLLTLGKLGFIKNKESEIAEAIEVLGSLKSELGIESPPDQNIAKKVALALKGKFPIIYGANVNFDIAVTRMRGELAENSKQLASSHVFPEMNHNEIVGWDFPAELMREFVVLFLRDSGDHKRVAKRMDITKDILGEKGVKIIDINSRGKGLLGRIMSLVFIGDVISFYLAILNGIDPTPVDKVTYLKNELAKEPL